VPGPLLRRPQIIERLLSTVDSTVGTVGGVANNALQPGGVVSQTVGTVGQVANTALQPGGLLSQTVNTLGQTVQRTFPGARVVKTLNCVSAELMTDPARLPGNHTVFVSGDDAAAKAAVVDMLRSFGWTSIVDLGGIASARGPEHFVALWVTIYEAFGITDFNFALLRGDG